MESSKIKFEKLPIKHEANSKPKDVYYVLENNKSEVIDAFRVLTNDEKDLIKSLITRMASYENYKSTKIKNHLKGYSFGEIRPMPHRFFFFQKYGNNIIFFAYTIKKRNSLPDKFYRKLDKERERYEREFEKFIQRNK